MTNVVYDLLQIILIPRFVKFMKLTLVLLEPSHRCNIIKFANIEVHMHIFIMLNPIQYIFLYFMRLLTKYIVLRAIVSFVTMSNETSNNNVFAIFYPIISSRNT